MMPLVDPPWFFEPFRADGTGMVRAKHNSCIKSKLSSDILLYYLPYWYKEGSNRKQTGCKQISYAETRFLSEVLKVKKQNQERVCYTKDGIWGKYF